MTEFLRSYWWLLFPVLGIAFSLASSFLNYCRQRDAIQLLRTYAAQGREPPPEVARMLDGARST